MSNLHYDQFIVSRKRGEGEKDRKRRGERSESTTKEGCDHLTYGLQCVTQLAVRRERERERERRERGGGGEREREKEREREREREVQRGRGGRGGVLERSERMRGRVCPFDLWS